MNYVVFGPYSSTLCARVAAQAKATADVDSYHDWNVHSLSPSGLAGEPLASYRKNDERPTSVYALALAEDRQRDRLRRKKPLRPC